MKMAKTLMAPKMARNQGYGTMTFSKLNVILFDVSESNSCDRNIPYS